MDELVGQTLPLKFGSTFQNNTKGSKQQLAQDGGGKFHTVRYDFKPARMPRDAVGDVTVQSDRDVTIKLPNPNEYEDEAIYKGNKKPAPQKECLLIIDHKTGEVTLEKLDSVLFVKKTRDGKKKTNVPAYQPGNMIAAQDSPTYSGSESSSQSQPKPEVGSLKRPPNTEPTSKPKKKSKKDTAPPTTVAPVVESTNSSTSTVGKQPVSSFADSIFTAPTVNSKKSSSKSSHSTSSEVSSGISTVSVDIPPPSKSGGGKTSSGGSKKETSQLPPAARPAHSLSDSDSDSSDDDSGEDSSSSSGSDDDSDDADAGSAPIGGEGKKAGLTILQKDLQLSDSD